MYSEPSGTSKMEFLRKISWMNLTVDDFAKHFILFVSQGYEYASDKTKQNPGVLSFFSTQSLEIYF